jgi:DnaK suppressor protein
MTPAQREALHQKLLELQKEHATKPPAEMKPNRVGAEDVGDAEDDQPLNEMLQAVSSGRNKNMARVAGLIGKALVKLRDDPEDYGLCEDCNESIALPRLNAMPYAALCVACQSKADGPRGGPRKSLTDYQ